MDIYALGCILYEALTGRPPFLDASLEALADRVRREEPMPPRRLQPRCPRDLETICLKCLEKEPARRYVGAAELADDLARFLAGESILARAPSILDGCVKFTRRHRAPVVGVLAVVAALAVGIAATSVMAVRESRARQQADRNAGMATENAHQAETARAAALREAYQARLAAAMAAMGTHDIREARRQLEAAPRDLCGWEWRHLQGRLDQSLTVVNGPSRSKSIAFCPPGRRLAVADGRSEYRLLDAVSGECLAVRSTESPCHQVFAFMTKAGPRLVLDQWDKDALFSLTDGNGVAVGRITLPGPSSGEPPCAIALSPDGRWLATQVSPYTNRPLVEVFDTSTGLLTAKFGGIWASLQALDFNPDGTRIAAVHHESPEVYIFDLRPEMPAMTLRGHSGGLRGVAYSRDGKRLATCGDDQTIRVWDTKTGKTLHTLRGHVSSVLCVGFSPDGRRLVSGGSDSTVRLWDVDGGEALLVLHGHTAAVNRVAFDAEGHTIASAASDGTARLWDAMAPDDISVLRGHTSYVYPVACSSDGRWIASGSWDRTIRLWDAARGSTALVLEGHTQLIDALAFTPDGTRLASWGEDQTIRLWDPATGKEIPPRLTHESMYHRDSVYSLVVSPDGHRLGAVTRGAVRFWDLATRAELAPLKLPIPDVRVVAFSPDGTRLAAGGDDSRVVIVDVASGGLIAEIRGFAGRIQSVAFSPDGRQVLTAGKDPTLRLWDAATGDLVRTFVGHGLEVLSAIFHPDGTRIASGGHDRSIRIWDVATGDELVRLPGHSWYVFSLAFSPDGETLVSGSGDSTVRLWDTFPVARRLRRAVPGRVATRGSVDESPPPGSLARHSSDPRSPSGSTAETPLRPARSGRSQSFTRQPGFHLVDVDDVVAFYGRILLGDDDPHASVDRIDAAGKHFIDGLLLLLDKGFEQPHGAVSHFVGVLADRDIDLALSHILAGQLVQVEGDDGRLFPQFGELGDLVGDIVSVVRPEAQENAGVGILADRGLDVDLGSGRVGAIFEDLQSVVLGINPEQVAGAGEEAIPTFACVGGSGRPDEGDGLAALRPERSRRTTGHLASLLVIGADVGPSGVLLPIRVDRDHHFA